MTALKETIESRLRRGVGASVSVLEAPDGALYVSTPFQYPDGDHLVIFVKEERSGSLMLTDRGHSLMRLSYRNDVEKIVEGTGNRNRLFESAIDRGDVVNWRGELVRRVGESEDVGGVLLEFAQTLIQVNDLEYLNREIVQSTFKDDLHEFVMDVAGPERVTEGWFDPENDPDQKYDADYKVDTGQTPVVLFALTSDTKTKSATISALQYEKWGLDLMKAGIMEDSSSIGEKAASQFMDVADEQFAFTNDLERNSAKNLLRAN